MRRITLAIAVSGLITAISGCSSQYATRYEYRYRAGTEYEYNKLMESYDPQSGNPAPLPPLSDEPTEGQWVRIPIQDPAYYPPSREVVVVHDPWYDPFYAPYGHYDASFGYYPGRRHRSGVSIGFGFGSAYSSGYYRNHPFGWYDPYCWP